jgi:hypothetical protein
MNGIRARAVVFAALFLSPLLAAQSSTETPATVVTKNPSRTDVRLGSTSYGELSIWKITDFRSPYFGLTLVWLELRESKTLVSVERTNGAPAIPTQPPSDALAILSGGSWTGAYDSPNSPKSASGLVVTSGSIVSALRPTQTGGVMFACDDHLFVYDADTYSKRYARGLPCQRASALQTSFIVVGDGKATSHLPSAERANRLAIGQDDDRVIIAGAFTPVGTALTLTDFASFVAAAAKKLGRNDLSALNLDGACSAQLSIPPIRQRFGCDRAGYNVNRIVVRREP